MIYLLVKQQCVEIDIVMNIQMFSDDYYAVCKYVYKYIQEYCTWNFLSAFMLISKIKGQGQLLGIQSQMKVHDTSPLVFSFGAIIKIYLIGIYDNSLFFG